MIPIYIINLDRAAARLDFIVARFATLGIAFHRIAAVDGNALAPADRTAFVAARPRDGKRGWRPGQIGCFLSHFEAWRQIADGTAPYGLVLEDDIHLSDAIVRFVADDAWMPRDADIVRIETTGQWLKLDAPAGLAHDRALRRVRSAAWGAGAYILGRDVARRLIESDAASQSPSDDFLFNPETSAMARALVTVQVVPALAVQDKFNAETRAIRGFGSDIETDKVNQRWGGIAALRRAITSTLRGKTDIRFV